jgi:hypothetical protein
MRNILAILLLLVCAQAGFGQLSGALSGTLGPGEFEVVDSIFINEGDSLRLMPGTTFNFDGPYPFEIYGILLAEGTETDSIIFTTDIEANPERWRGLRFFYTSNSGSRLAYNMVENGLAAGTGESGYGGGIYCWNSSPVFAHCTIYYNSADDGGGLRCSENSSPAFTHCIFYGNYSDGYGGGISCRDVSSATFTNCIINNNEADSDGAGVYCTNSSIDFTDCIISSNSSNIGDGGGICINNAASTTFNNCIICVNTAVDGGGVNCSYSHPLTFNNCIFYWNSVIAYGGGVSCYESSPTFTNCTITANGSLGDGGALDSRLNPAPSFMNCILWGNTSPQIRTSSSDPQLTYSDIQDGWPGEGNIDEDPLFRDVMYGDFHLQSLTNPDCGDTADSPCIDAGNPSIEDDSLDCDFGLGTIRSDMGAYGGSPVPSGVSHPNNPVMPVGFALFQNYPNPFNPTTIIRYDVKQPGLVSLKVFDILGRKVTTLIHGTIQAGSHTISWDASGLPSGIYLCRMEAPGFTQTRKMMLLK